MQDGIIRRSDKSKKRFCVLSSWYLPNDIILVQIGQFTDIVRQTHGAQGDQKDKVVDYRHDLASKKLSIPPHVSEYK